VYVCGVSRSSKFALKRHQQHEHPSDAKPATHLSEVVVAVPTVTVPQKCVKNTRVVTIAATQQPKSTLRGIILTTSPSIGLYVVCSRDINRIWTISASRQRR